jgi:hypothetical protein
VVVGVDSVSDVVVGWNDDGRLGFREAFFLAEKKVDSFLGTERRRWIAISLLFSLKKKRK